MRRPKPGTLYYGWVLMVVLGITTIISCWQRSAWPSLPTRPSRGPYKGLRQRVRESSGVTA